MATQDQLRQQIRDLERQLHELSNRQKELTLRMQQQNNSAMREMRAELQAALQRKDAQSARQIGDIRTQMSIELQEAADAIRREAAQAQQEREALLVKLEYVNQELRRELDEIKQREYRRTESGYNLAKELAAQATQQEQIVAELPHMFFCPGQLDIFREHLSSVRTMMEAQLFDAAAAAADASLAELEILEINVRENQREWEEQYTLYRTLISALHDQMEQFEAGEIQTECGSFVLSPEERSYWSQSKYDVLRQDILTAWGIVEQIESADSVTAYLKDGGATKGFAFSKAITSLYRLNERYNAAEICIRNERFYSDQRYRWGKMAVGCLEDVGYHIVDDCFRRNPHEEPIDSYDILATVNDLDYLRVTFIPVREDGVTIRNQCQLVLNVLTSPNEAFIAQSASEISERLKGRIPEVMVTWHREGSDAVKKEEQTIKKKPDMQIMSKKLERKYQ